MPVQERLQVAQSLDDPQRRSLEASVKETEEQWSSVSRAADKALNAAQIEAAVEREYETFRERWEYLQSWIREQKQKIMSITALGTSEERLQLAQAVLNSKPEGDSKMRELSRQAQSLLQSPDLDSSRRAEVERMVLDVEQQWKTALQTAAQAELRSLSDDFDNQSQTAQSWIRERHQQLQSVGGQTPPQQRIHTAQAVLSCKPDGDCRVNNLRRRGQSLSDHRDLSDGRKQQLQQTVKDTEEQWRNVLQNAKQIQNTAEEQVREEEESKRRQLKEFDSQKEETCLWLKDLQQRLACVKEQPTAEDRLNTAQTILSSKADGDSKLQELRRRSQNLHPDVDRADISRTVEELERQWAELLQDVRLVLDQSERQCVLENLLKEYNQTRDKTCAWIQEREEKVKELDVNAEPEQTISTAQTCYRRAEGNAEESRGPVHRPQGDGRFQSPGNQHRILVKDLRRQLEEKGTGATGTQAEIEERLNTAQLSAGTSGASGVCQFQRSQLESRLSELKTQTSSLPRVFPWPGLGERRQTADQTRTMIDQTTALAPAAPRPHRKQAAELAELTHDPSWTSTNWNEMEQCIPDLLKQLTKLGYNCCVLGGSEFPGGGILAERQCTQLMEQHEAAQDWLREQVKALGPAPEDKHGLHSAVNTLKMVLNCRLNGDNQLKELKRRAQSLSENTDLDQNQRLEIQNKDFRSVWCPASSSVPSSSPRLSELKTQTSSLPRVFPVARTRGEETDRGPNQNHDRSDHSFSTAAPRHTQTGCRAAELTHDPSWTSTNWNEMEQCIPDLLKQLTEALSFLEEGILAERQCTQLMEQHEAAQDWLREQVKALDRPQRINTASTALLQTVHREQTEMGELDKSRDGLLDLCTPGGRDALTLDVSHLHDLCATSEQEVKQHLTFCEARLEAMERQVEQRAQGLKERASALQWELRSLDQALSYSQPQNNISQLQQHWNSLKNCEKSLEGLRVKLDELLQDVASAPQTEELPTDVTTLVKSLSQQHDSLKSRLSDHQTSCSTNADRCFKDCLQNLQQWNDREAPETSDSLQESLEEGEKYRLDLQEALSHWQFLSDCLSPLVFGKLDLQSSETLTKAETQKNTFDKKKEELDARPKFKPTMVQMPTEVSLVAPPRKSAHR
ncbi:hypothetical protein WMY93_027566 [Mugilogobius chulae]|uniref:Uncharacterized protein n=1 Tax=Mugilogobius chulae TaxID=88201 RepID=A0AAW0MXV0_9GOBI